MKIRKLTNEEIKGACAFAVSIYNIAIRGCFRTLDCHRYFDEYMDADRLTDEERIGVLVVFGAFDSNVLCGVCGMTNEGHITMLYVHPQYLRRGIGKKLLERVRIYARMQLKLMQVSVKCRHTRQNTSCMWALRVHIREAFAMDKAICTFL